MLQTVLNDLATLRHSYRKSLSPKIDIVDLYLKDGSLTTYNCTAPLLQLDISTAYNLFLNYTPKVYLERYMRYKKGRGRVSDEDHTLKTNYRLAGFKRQFYSEEKPLTYNRVVEFDINSNNNVFDIKFQSYFRFNILEYIECEIIGARRRGPMRDIGGSRISQLFRFVLEFEVEGTLIKKNLRPFYMSAHESNDEISFTIRNT